MYTQARSGVVDKNLSAPAAAVRDVGWPKKSFPLHGRLVIRSEDFLKYRRAWRPGIVQAEEISSFFARKRSLYLSYRTTIYLSHLRFPPCPYLTRPKATTTTTTGK